jgi:hypothetical protein
VTNNRTGELDKPLDGGTVHKGIVRKYALETGISTQINGLCVHSLRATAATNALSREADIAKVQKWLGHANASTTRLYDRRKTRHEDDIWGQVLGFLQVRWITAASNIAFAMKQRLANVERSGWGLVVASARRA